jgi:hypothetical protein
MFSDFWNQLVDALKQFIAVFVAWYSGKEAQQAETNQKVLEKLQEAFSDKVAVKREVEEMTDEEKNRIAYGENKSTDSVIGFGPSISSK